jgi:hypothetical protein
MFVSCVLARSKAPLFSATRVASHHITLPCMHPEGVRAAVQRQLPVLFSEGAPLAISRQFAFNHNSPCGAAEGAAQAHEGLTHLHNSTAAYIACVFTMFCGSFARFLPVLSTSCYQVVATNVAAVEVTLSRNITSHTAHTCLSLSLLFCNATAPKPCVHQATLADRQTPDAAALAVYDSAVQLPEKVRVGLLVSLLC